jgi:HPt (histidine-containing phosphotransfer) domain-containing protein
LPLIDAAQLARRTMGDPTLQVELLALFVTELERLMRQVEGAPDPQLRGDRLRAMTTLARNTGAAHLAQVARLTETRLASDDADLSPLRAAVAETVAYVNQTGAWH